MRSSRIGLAAIAAMASVGLAGCIVVQDYVPPAAGETAEFTVVNGTAGTVQVFIFREPTTCKGRNSMPLMKPGASASTTIRAGGPIAMWAISSRGVYGASCSYMFTFDATPSKRYLLRIREAGNMCGFRVEDATSSNPGPRVPARERTRGVPMDENSSFCDPIK